MIFNRQLTQTEIVCNLTALGPDFTELTPCQVGNWKPNYAHLNLSKLQSSSLGHFAEAMRQLKDSRVLLYSAQQPDMAMAYDPTSNAKPKNTHVSPSKVQNSNLGNATARQLVDSRLYPYTAQQPEMTTNEVDNVAYGRPLGLILYGELIQNQLPSLQTATILCGGLATQLYLFARVVECTNTSEAQAMALDLLLNAAMSESQLFAEFWRNDYVSLIGYVIKTERCTKDVNLLRSIVNNACSQPVILKKINENTTASLIYPRLLTSVLHRYSDWHRSGAEHSNVLDALLQCILALTREKHPQRDFNIEQLSRAGLVKELLNLCKVFVIESPNPVHISVNAAQSFVNILSVFAGSPPSPSLMDEIMKLLLLLHKPSECYVTHDRAKFYFLLSQEPPTKERGSSASGSLTNLSRVAAPFRRSFGRTHPGVATPIPTPTPDLDANRMARINALRRFHARISPYKQALTEFEDNLENVADCSKLNKNALRLVSPLEAAQWRNKYKRRLPLNLTPSPKKVYPPQKPHKTPLATVNGYSASIIATPQRIVHKRLRRQLSASRFHTHCLEGERSGRHASGGSLHSATPIGDGDFSEGGGTSNDVFLKTPKSGDFYSSAGIVALQDGLFTLLRNFLCLLPDNAVEEVLRHYVKVEFLVILANHSSCAVRATILRLLAALTKRLSPQELQTCVKGFYPQHLANQLTIYPTDALVFEACVEWATGVYGSLEDILSFETLRLQNRFSLGALLATPSKLAATQSELIDKCFRIIRLIYAENPDDQQALIEAGLLQCCVKTLHKLHAKAAPVHPSAENSILELLTCVGEKSLKSVGQINIVWDILNMLSFYQTEQPPFVVTGFRSVQSQLQLKWINLFFEKTSIPWIFTVRPLPDSALTPAETRTRLDLLVDHCSQFFTIFDAGCSPSAYEIKLFRFLVSYVISTNQRCNNFLAWGLQPSRPLELRSFIVDALWIICQKDCLPPIIRDGKMIKSLLWLCLLEDLDEPIENLGRLCQRLGITENDSTWNLENELGRIELHRRTFSERQKGLMERTIHKFEPLALGCIESSMDTTRRVAELQNAERKVLMSKMKDYDETCLYTKWLEILRRMTHEGAPWYAKSRSESSWELDDTEGPSRVHTRLRRCHLDIDRRFFMADYDGTAGQPQKARPDAVYQRPLDYLIASYDQQLNISLNAQILYNFPAKYLPVDGEIDGEIIVTDHRLYFLATYRCKYFYVTCDIANITEIWIKRYQHQEKAFEIFLDTNKSLLFSLQNLEDWKILRDVFCDKIVTPPDQGKVLQVTQQWREGLLTNWEYLMTLNQIAGRTYNDLMQYPVFPWILSNYCSNTLDLTNPENFRKLEKPIAVQHEGNEKHYISNYTYINNTMTNMGSLVLKPYHYSSHYSNSGTVLHFMVRVPPFTSYFLRYQDNNFDLPDRTFHALDTTWNLASRDSPTDVKELIPEFFCLPEMFENFERFDFGCRQSGDRVEDVLLPVWCKRNPRLFTLIHRQALESEAVRSCLHQWIDLIFGFKQTGESAVKAINVFHPATYSVFLESEIHDPIERKAVETMVKTYGQMPRQLFKVPHPTSKPLQYSVATAEILPSVQGLRWGVYLGSPQLPKPTLGNIHKLPGAEYLVALGGTNVVYGLPQKSCVMQGPETDTFNVISWGYDDRIVRIQPLNKPLAKPKNLMHNTCFDDITACGTEPNSNQLWFGHKSGRISVYKCCSAESAAGIGRSSSAKSRQSYVRGLRLSYNSAFRKMTTKSGADGDADSPSAMAGGAHALGTEDGAELRWSGPVTLVRHADEITCIQLSVEFKIAVSAGRDGIAVIWDLNDWSYVRTIERPAEIHHSPVTLVAISPTLGDIVTVHTISSHGSQPETEVDADEDGVVALAADECFEVTEESLDDFVNVAINPNGKSIMRLHSVNARYIKHLVNEEQIYAVTYSYIKEGVGVNVVATAIDGGIVRLWSSWNLDFVAEIVTGISNIRSITYSTHQHLVVLTKESHIQVWETEGLCGNPPKFPQIAYK